jgi:7,8-dihydropterin-6-yl-methyl-4-(beta-D-ribofuranosyl)aminobenzene 5'-phosphate synthase
LKISVNGKILDDPFNDDLSLLLETHSGPVVLLGCAHAGIVEILDDLSAKTGHREFHAVIGGIHLGTASEEYIEKAIESFRKYNVKIIGTSHCTGFHASARIMARFKKEFVPAHVGSVFEF